jgi:hypothetical protein
MYVLRSTYEPFPPNKVLEGNLKNHMKNIKHELKVVKLDHEHCGGATALRSRRLG